MQIYLLTFPNSKKYVGITSKTAAERFKRHCSASGARAHAVQRAIRKYGKENITVTVLATLRPTAEDYDICWRMLCAAEQRMITHYDTFGANGYNMTLGGEGTIKINLPKDERIARDRELNKERSARWQENNVEHIKEKCREHQKENKERIRAYGVQYRKDNKDKLQEKYAANADAIKIRKREYDRVNKERLNQKCREYGQANREAIKTRALRNREQTNARVRARYAERKGDPAFKAAQAAKNLKYPRRKMDSALKNAKSKKHYENNKEEINRKKREKRLTLKAQTVLIEEI